LQKKWTKDKISSLIAWNYETYAICGPRIDLKKAGNTGLHVEDAATCDADADYCHMTVGKTAAEVTEMKDHEMQMLCIPHSTTRRLSPQTALNDDIDVPSSSAATDLYNSHAVSEKSQREVVNSCVDHSSEDVGFVITKRKGTCEYTWLESSSHLPPADNKENTASSFSQNSDAGIDDVVQTVRQVNCRSTRVTTAFNDNLHMDREHLVNNSSATKLQRDEETTEKKSSDEHILSFPLFASPALASEAPEMFVRLPSVSAILKATMPPESQLALTRWEQRMITELGEDGFKEYQKGLSVGDA